ncbi:MAG: hydrogenase formation protein HypD [Desulfobacterales bacterium]|nr:MAG: hydrogenase formation protein HypD [Desulfobacterales bacterium]
MPIKHLEEYRDPAIARKIVEQITFAGQKPIRLMEVCGTHTMSIFKHGIRGLLPETISLLSGPGCPVCVTAQNEINSFIRLSRFDDVIITTFGDLIKVPGADSSLEKERADGRDIRIVYSTFDALKVAQKNPLKKVVFLGVGFETTAPTIAASIRSAVEMKLDNYFVFCAHKLLPPALAFLMEAKGTKIDGFILPGHVSVIIGIKAYLPFFEHYQTPCVIAGFEPLDILLAVNMLVVQIKTNQPKLSNAYQRAVTFNGNQKAQNIMNDVFETTDARWRGIGTIPQSGLKIRDEFAICDASKMFEINMTASSDPKGCACGEILTGQKIPTDCLLYRKACTLETPIGPCMVSSEGACAAFYRYHPM